MLYTDDNPTRKAVEALNRLRAAGYPVCFMTNTSRRTRTMLVQKLSAMGFEPSADEILTAAGAAHALITTERLHPHLLIYPDLREEFHNLGAGPPDCVPVGDAGESFTYDAMNAAFRVLMDSTHPRLLAMGDNRYFAGPDGLCLDMGPFVRGLEYAAGICAEIVGKPAMTFFQAGLERVGCPAGRTVMIGDDIAADVGGAQAAGLHGVLVRTGKYRPGDEGGDIHPDHVAEDFADAVEWLLS